MDFRQNQPIYLHIAEYVCEQILLKKWKLGDKILSIRDIAVEMGAGIVLMIIKWYPSHGEVNC